MNRQPRDFNKEAARWDDNPTRVKLAEDVVKAITDRISLTPEMDVLDFGCGTGLLALRLAPLVRSVTGADSSRGMLNVLAAKATKWGLANVRALHLPAGGDIADSYNLIVSGMVLHHVEHLDALLAQLFRACKTPGLLCVADLDPEQGLFHEDNRGVYHFGFERSEMRQQFSRAGFAKVLETTAATVMKPTRNGDLRAFTVFLVCGEKTGP